MRKTLLLFCIIVFISSCNYSEYKEYDYLDYYTMSGKNVDEEMCPNWFLFVKDVANFQKILYKRSEDTIWIVQKDIGNYFTEKYVFTNNYWVAENHYYQPMVEGIKLDYGRTSERKIIRNDTLFWFIWDEQTLSNFTINTISKNFSFSIDERSANELIKTSLDSLSKSSYRFSVTSKTFEKCQFVSRSIIYYNGEKKYNRVSYSKDTEYYRDRVWCKGLEVVKPAEEFKSLLPVTY